MNEQFSKLRLLNTMRPGAFAKALIALYRTGGDVNWEAIENKLNDEFINVKKVYLDMYTNSRKFKTVNGRSLNNVPVNVLEKVTQNFDNFDNVRNFAVGMNIPLTGTTAYKQYANAARKLINYAQTEDKEKRKVLKEQFDAENKTNSRMYKAIQDQKMNRWGKESFFDVIDCIYDEFFKSEDLQFTMQNYVWNIPMFEENIILGQLEESIKDFNPELLTRVLLIHALKKAISDTYALNSQTPDL